MGASNQLYAYTLPSQTYSAGQRTTNTLRDLPKTMLGRIAHLAKFIFAVTMTPTWTTAGPDVVGMNNIFTAANFWDGTYSRFQGGFNHMRMKDRLQTGKVRMADASTVTASASARFFRRVLHVGPPQFVNAPSDFYIPCGYLVNGELQYTHGQLTDLAGNGGGTISACTGSVRVLAFLALLDEVRVPPAYQFQFVAANAQDVNLPGQAMYEGLAFVTGNSFTAWTAGQIGNVRVDLGQGDFVASVKAADLAASFADDFAAGTLDVPQGDPEGTADTNNVTVNRAAPTALTTPPNDLAPAMWSPQDSRITKLQLAQSTVRVRWDGSSTSAQILQSRILLQAQSQVTAFINKALGQLGVKNKGVSYKTISKDKYEGPLIGYMPIKVSV